MPEQKRQAQTPSNLFRFGESYSSLLLGIIVVIITTVLLVFLVKDRNIPQKGVSSTSTQNKNTKIAAKLTVTPALSVIPSLTVILEKPTATSTQPTGTPKVTSVKKPSPTIQPTKVTAPTNTPVPTKVIVKVSPTKAVAVNVTPSSQLAKGKVHTVANGESLWTIAEEYYKSGYNWVDIAKANNLSNPGVISVGMKLTIPSVAAKVATVVTTPEKEVTAYGPKITGTTYVVQKGDHLWGISVRAYADGYRWLEIARVNNIQSPNVIQPGLVLKIPRTTTNSLGLK